MPDSTPVPVVFLPGLLCDAELWHHQIAAFSGHITPYVADLTGFDSISALAANVLAKAPDRFALAALSMGGYVALEIMRQAPERVRKLCLCDTSARPDTPEQHARREALLALSRAGQFKGVTPRLLPLLIHPDRLNDAAITGVIMRMAQNAGRETFRNQQTAIMHRPDSRAGLTAIRCPTLVLGGRQDQLTPVEVMEEIAAGIPNADYHIIEDCGHLAPLEQPEVVNRLIAGWLSA